MTCTLFDDPSSRCQQRPADQDAERGEHHNDIELGEFCFVEIEIATDNDEPTDPSLAPSPREQYVHFGGFGFKLEFNLGPLTFLFPQIKPPSNNPLRHKPSASLSSGLRNQNSLAQSIGSTVSRSNSTIARPQTSMSFQQSTNARQRSNTSRVRPQTAMNTRASEDTSTTGKKNCTMTSPTQSFSDSLQFHKIRKAASAQSIGSRPSAPLREVSISTMMGNLSLEDERAYAGRLKPSQAILAKENLPPFVSLPPSSTQVANSACKQEAKDCLQQEDSRVCTMAPPKTPVSTADAQKALDTFEETLLASTRKRPGSPTKSPSKIRPFLTKDSNTRTFTAWDVDERLVEVEAQFKAMKEVMNGSLSDKKAMEEVIEMAKTRGMYSLRTRG